MPIPISSLPINDFGFRSMFPGSIALACLVFVVHIKGTSAYIGRVHAVWSLSFQKSRTETSCIKQRNGVG